MLAVSPVPVPDTGARASDGAHGWARVLSTYPCVNQAEQVITGARSAVQAIAPSDPFPDKEWMDVVSKADLTLSADVEARIPEGAVRISSKTKDGMRELMKWIGAALERSETAQAERAARLQYEKEAKREFR